MRSSIRLQRPHHAGPRAGILAIATVFILAATAFASSRLSLAARQELRQGGSVVYPATYAVPLGASAKETNRLNSIMMGSEFIRVIRGYRDAATRGGIVLPFLQGPKVWSRIALPADLSRTIGGAAMYVLRGDGRIRELVCIRGNTLYRLPDDLNQMLKDCGMRFTNADVHTWTPVVVFVCLACDRISALESGMYLGEEIECTLDSIVGGQAPLVPSVTVSKLVADTARPEDVGHSLYPALPGYVSRVWVHVQVNDSSWRVGTDTASIHTQNGSPRGDGLYPVLFVYPARNTNIRLSKPRLGELDEGHPELCIVKDGGE